MSNHMNKFQKFMDNYEQKIIIFQDYCTLEEMDNSLRISLLSEIRKDPTYIVGYANDSRTPQTVIYRST